MNSDVNKNMAKALRLLLKPIAKLLIGQGITHRDFSEAAKDVFVEMALREQEESGSKINRSRVAIQTGLTRKEVKTVMDNALAETPNARNFSRPGKVLHGWYNDPTYLGPYGLPLEIPYDSESKDGSPPSFVHLVKIYSGDQSAVQMLEELTRVKAVERERDGTLKVLRRDYEPESFSPEMIERFGSLSSSLITTLAINVRKEKSGKGVFDRTVISNQMLTESELAEFKEYLTTNGQDMLVAIDAWLTRNVAKKDEVEMLGTAAVWNGEQVFESGVAMIQFITRNPEEKGSLKDYLIRRRNDF